MAGAGMAGAGKCGKREVKGEGEGDKGYAGRFSSASSSSSSSVGTRDRNVLMYMQVPREGHIVFVENVGVSIQGSSRFPFPSILDEKIRRR